LAPSNVFLKWAPSHHFPAPKIQACSIIIIVFMHVPDF
jgi:hypothetical protein